MRRHWISVKPWPAVLHGHKCECCLIQRLQRSLRRRLRPIAASNRHGEQRFGRGAPFPSDGGRQVTDRMSALYYARSRRRRVLVASRMSDTHS